MKYDIIQVHNYLLAVVNDRKRGWFYCVRTKSFFHDEGEDVLCCNGDLSVEAHLPLNGANIIENLPLLPPLEQEDDVNKLAENEYREYPNNPKDKPDWHYNKDIHCHKKRKAFIKGYNKSRETYKYTEDDLRMAIQMAQIQKFDEGKYVGLFFNSDEIIQSLSQPKYPIAFEQGNIVDGKNYISVTRRHDNFTLWIGKYIY
jgi:hypothetical protein